MRNRQLSERGAVAVEMAILLPSLLLLLLGIIEFGRLYNAQLTLTHAARESVRTMAITGIADQARDSAIDSAVSLRGYLEKDDITISSRDPASPTSTDIVDACAPNYRVTVSIQYEFDSITGFVGSLPLTAQGVMRCGG